MFSEQVTLVRSALARIIGTVAKLSFPQGTWPQLMQLLWQLQQARPCANPLNTHARTTCAATKPEMSSNSAAERHAAAQGNCDERTEQHVRQHAQSHATPPRILTPNPVHQPVSPPRARSKGRSSGNTQHFTN